MFFILVLLASALAEEAVIRYDGYRVVEVGPLNTEENVRLINSLVDHDQRLREVMLMEDYVSKIAPVSLAVSPYAFSRVQQILEEQNIRFSVVNSNLQKTIDESMRMNAENLAKIAKPLSEDPTQFNHDAYLTYDQQADWVRAVAAASPIAISFNIGLSTQNREIVGIAINSGVTGLPALWIDANIHAREWITSASALYTISEILNGTSTEGQYLRSNFRIVFVPNLNPDGYTFSHTNDRLWRKTRSNNPGSLCVGTDANRNWDSNWGGEGSGALPCSDTYRGASAFSEPETRAAADFLEAFQEQTNLFISVHCYSEFWLVPWGGTRDKPSDYDELMRVGNAAADAIRAIDSRNFLVGTPPDILYVASGGSFDWAKEKVNIQYAYSPELRPATAGQGGFILPPDQIINSGRELLASIAASAREAKHKPVV